MGIVCGVGFNDGKYPTSEGGRGSRKLKQYRHWKNMLERCYNDKTRENYPAYDLAEVSENFKSYSYFYEWCELQQGFNEDGWHLDKDLLVKGSKLYSEDLCLFLPAEINVLLVKSDSTRGIYPIGVSFCKHKGLFESRIRVDNKNKFLGYYHDPLGAHNKYKHVKERHIKEVANRWRGSIDNRAYSALINYQVEITD